MMTLDIPIPIPNLVKPDNLAVNKICISEPDDSNPRTPLTPDLIDRTPDEKSNHKNQLTPTITEETEQDDQSVSCKSSLSLPVEPPIGPAEKDRRKLSVQGLMAFAERRRSSSTFADMRKMSISNGDGIHMRSPGGTGKLKIADHFLCSLTIWFFSFECSHTGWTAHTKSAIVKNDEICGMLGR